MYLDLILKIRLINYGRGNRKMIQNAVKLDSYNNLELIAIRCIEINEWYDGDIVEIDSAEYIIDNGITHIKGTQYGSNGSIDECWSNYYDKVGRITKNELYDSCGKVIESETINYDSVGKVISN